MARPSPLSRPGPRMQSGLGPPHPAEVITYEPTPGDLDATNVQDAIDELYELLGSASGVLPLTAVVDGEPVLVWDVDDSLIPVDF